MKTQRYYRTSSSQLNRCGNAAVMRYTLQSFSTRTTVSRAERCLGLEVYDKSSRERVQMWVELLCWNSTIHFPPSHTCGLWANRATNASDVIYQQRCYKSFFKIRGFCSAHLIIVLDAPCLTSTTSTPKGRDWASSTNLIQLLRWGLKPPFVTHLSVFYRRSLGLR